MTTVIEIVCYVKCSRISSQTALQFLVIALLIYANEVYF